MSIRFLTLRAFIPAVCFLSAMSFQISPASAQTTPATQDKPSTPDNVTASKPSQAPALKEPDYPDPRSFTIGIMGLAPLSSYAGPDIRGGKTAANINLYESLFAIGTPYKVLPQFELSMPVTRTGTLYVEFDRFHGWSDRTLTRDTFVDSYNFTSGNTLHVLYHMTSGRLYLDDLFFPHKFPVAKLRFKSLLGVRYVSLTHELDSNSQDVTAGTPGASFQLSTNFVLLPSFGMAAEYAVAKHALFRVEGAGFGLPHRSNVADANAYLSIRQKNLEIMGGVKMLHFKTSPQKEQYYGGTFVTPFVGLRWHF